MWAQLWWLSCNATVQIMMHETAGRRCRMMPYPVDVVDAQAIHEMHKILGQLDILVRLLPWDRTLGRVHVRCRHDPAI